MTSVLTDDDLAAATHGISILRGYKEYNRAIEAAVIKRLAAGVSVEPVGSVIEHVGVTDGVVEFTTPTCGPLPIGTNLVTLDQLTTATAAARVQENERCLALMDAIGCDWRDAGDMAKFYAANYLREAIRALLGKEAT